MKMHSQRGRGSCGPRARTLVREEVLARRDEAMRLPPSPERSAALAVVRRQLTTIANRTERTRGGRG
jgi:hypothetical protein